MMDWLYQVISTIPTTTNYDLTLDSTRYTDWQKELIGGTAEDRDVQTSISGGTSNTQYILSPGIS